MGVARGSGGRSRATARSRDAPARGPRVVLYLLGAAALLGVHVARGLELGQVGLLYAAVLVLVGLLGGREDGPWGAALVVGLAGAGALLVPHLPERLDVTRDAAAACGGGLGLLLTAALELRGVRTGLAATAAAVAAVVAVVGARYDVPALARPGTWAALLFLLGAVNLLLWARDREAGLTGARG